MDLSQHFKVRGGRYLKAADVPAPMTVTIRGCTMDKFENGDGPNERPVVWFRETPKGLVLNQTNFDKLVNLLHAVDSDNWLGEQVELYRDDNVSYLGNQGAIRIREAPAADEDTPF